MINDFILTFVADEFTSGEAVVVRRGRESWFYFITGSTFAYSTPKSIHAKERSYEHNLVAFSLFCDCYNLRNNQCPEPLDARNRDHD